MFLSKNVNRYTHSLSPLKEKITPSNSVLVRKGPLVSHETSGKRRCRSTHLRITCVIRFVKSSSSVSAKQKERCTCMSFEKAIMHSNRGVHSGGALEGGRISGGIVFANRHSPALQNHKKLNYVPEGNETFWYNKQHENRDTCVKVGSGFCPNLLEKKENLALFYGTGFPRQRVDYSAVQFVRIPTTPGFHGAPPPPHTQHTAWCAG